MPAGRFRRDLAGGRALSAVSAILRFESVCASGWRPLRPRATGSATRPRRAIVLEQPPSLDAGEITDKGSLNQRAILDRRRLLVDDLFAGHQPPHVISCRCRSGPAHEC